MMRINKSGHAALLRPTYSGSLAALALAVAAIAAPASFAQGKSEKPAATTTQTSQPATAQNSNRADAYYHYMLAHEYEEMANTYGRSEYATRAVEEYKMALNDDPDSTFLNNGLAELYYRTGRVKDAINAAQAQISKDPDNLSAHKLLGNIYLRSLGENEHSSAEGDVLKLAIGEYEKIVQLEPKSVQNHLILGQLYSFAHESNKAEDQFSAAQKINPGSQQTALSLARLYSGQGDSKRAIKILSALPEQDQTAKTQYVLGASYDQQKDTKNAIIAYRKALDMEPDNLDVERALAKDLLADNQLTAARDAYKDIASNDPSDPEAYLRLSEIERRQGNYDEALATLKKAKALVPDSLEISFNEGLLDDALGHYNDAIAIFQKLVAGSEQADGKYTDQEKNNRSLFLDRLAILYREQTKFDDAIATYQKMAQLGGDYEEHAYNSEVDTYRDAHEYDKATQVAREAAAKNPKNNGLQLMLALQLPDSGHPDEGIALAKSRLNGSSSDLETWRALTTIYTRLRRWKDAEDALSHVQQLSKNKDDLLYAAFLEGTLNDRQQKYDQAEAAFRKALAIDPQNPMTLNYLGYMLADHDKNLQEALSLLQKAVKLDPQNYAYLDSLGWAYFKLGKYDLAEVDLRKAVERNSTDPTVHDHLGELYEKTGRLKEAAAQWEQSLKEYAVTAPADTDPGSMSKVQKRLDSARIRLAREAAHPSPTKN
ncbi:MAG TPA: tetratricopeptide repeat protein [Acidobacteriaceae bacterium]|nr:tetratricopeptide repeat protein [Acidobacteriaceae bacterium]